MKLHLTLEGDDGQKVERKIEIQDIENYDMDIVGHTVISMIESLLESKKPL